MLIKEPCLTHAITEKMKLEKIGLLLVVLMMSLVSIGCDSNDEEDEFEGILGIWQQVENDPDTDVFVNVTREQIVVAASSSLISTVACSTLDIVDYNPDTGVMNVTDSDGDPGVANVRVSGDGVIVDGDTYMRGNSFPTCTVNLSTHELNDKLELDILPGIVSELQ